MMFYVDLSLNNCSRVGQYALSCTFWNCFNQVLNREVSSLEFLLRHFL